MKIEIEIKDDIIHQWARKAASEVFVAGNYSRDESAGLALVRKLTREQIESEAFIAELRVLIRSAAINARDAIVADVVDVELRKKVKEIVKKEREAGTLFD